jgi:hypothetical protein
MHAPEIARVLALHAAVHDDVTVTLKGTAAL